MTAVAAAGVAYLLIVQIAVIGAICDWCLVNDALVTVLAGLVLLRAMAAPSTTYSEASIRPESSA